MLCLLSQGCWIKLGPIKKNERWGKSRTCAGRWNNDECFCFPKRPNLHLRQRCEVQRYFKVISSYQTYQDGLSWFEIAVTGAPRLGLQYFVSVDPTSQLMGQPVKPTCGAFWVPSFQLGVTWCWWCALVWKKWDADYQIVLKFLTLNTWSCSREAGREEVVWGRRDPSPPSRPCLPSCRTEETERGCGL